MSEGPTTRLANSVVVSSASTGTTPDASASGRPSVLSLSIKEKAALYAAYMPYLQNGGIFVPTSKTYQLGDEVYLILTLMDDQTKLPIAGKVVWVSAAGGRSRQPGIGVHFPADDSGGAARKAIEDILGAALKSARPTLTI
jgi:type IV pilus assembly protein PilZ